MSEERSDWKKTLICIHKLTLSDDDPEELLEAIRIKAVNALREGKRRAEHDGEGEQLMPRKIETKILDTRLGSPFMRLDSRLY